MIELINSFKSYVTFGTLGQKDGDMGDSSQRIGHFYALAGLLKAPIDFTGRDLALGWQVAAELHETNPGLYRRSPNPLFWGHNPDNFSRDQHSILRIAMAIMKDKKRLKESALAMIKRLGFHQNTKRGTLDSNPNWKVPDIITPMEIAVIIRGLDAWYLYPLLLILDLTLFIDLLLRKDDNWDADNMLALNILYAYIKIPTIFSYLAMTIYKSTNFLDRIKNYYSIDNGNNGLEPMYQLFKLAYEELT